jgi:hypothetical protein
MAFWKRLLKKDLQIKDEGGSNLEYKGTYLVQMQILGRKVMHDLLVLETVQDKILRIDFIRQHALIYNALSDKNF